MPKSVEFCQLVARAINHTTWIIPRIRDGDRSSSPPSTKNFPAGRNFPSDTFPSPDTVNSTIAVCLFATPGHNQHTVAIT